MNIPVRELAAWPLDDYPYRPAHLVATNAPRTPFISVTPIDTNQTAALQPLFAPHASRPDLHEEMANLPWSLAVIDLRTLLAFQRRLSFHPACPPITVPSQDDWQALTHLCLAPPKLPVYTQSHLANTLTLTSTDPNLHLRVSSETPLTVHAGSPFLEVAHYRDRWFLRDGYHRAFALLRGGVTHVPAVVVHCATLADLGANQPWFFPESVLFSATPPRVVDLLDDTLVLQYHRPQLLKTLTITYAETLLPQGDPS